VKFDVENETFSVEDGAVEAGTFGPVLHVKFHPHRCNLSPLRREKPQNLPLSSLNNRRFALRTMLPVNDCSAVAAMGDRLATIDMGQKLGAVPLGG